MRCQKALWIIKDSRPASLCRALLFTHSQLSGMHSQMILFRSCSFCCHALQLSYYTGVAYTGVGAPIGLPSTRSCSHSSRVLRMHLLTITVECVACFRCLKISASKSLMSMGTPPHPSVHPSTCTFRIHPQAALASSLRLLFGSDAKLSVDELL
jgi:hypothetical protein